MVYVNMGYINMMYPSTIYKLAVFVLLPFRSSPMTTWAIRRKTKLWWDGLKFAKLKVQPKMTKILSFLVSKFSNAYFSTLTTQEVAKSLLFSTCVPQSSSVATTETTNAATNKNALTPAVTMTSWWTTVQQHSIWNTQRNGWNMPRRLWII